MTPRCFGDRLAMPLHRRQQLGNAAAVDLLDAEELRQRLVRTADLGEHLALLGGAGEPPEFGDELPDRTMRLRHDRRSRRYMRGQIALQPGLVVPVGAGRIARPPFLPMGIGRLHVDEFVPEPAAAQTQMRIEPDVRELNKLFKSVLSAFQQVILRRPLDREPGPDLDRGFRRGVDDLRLVVDMIDPKFDAMLDAAGLDDRNSRCIGIAADLAIEHIAHGENGLERIALRAAGRRDIKPRGWRPGSCNPGST